MSPSSTAVIILAGGLGTRMRSATPKMLHEICGRPMLAYILDAARTAVAAKPIVVFSPATQAVKDRFAAEADFVQAEPRGSGYAVQTALESLAPDIQHLIVIYGDTPLVTPATIKTMLGLHLQTQSAVTLAAVETEDPKGYGRLIRDHAGSVIKIVEEKDATDEERAITLINAGLYCFDAAWLRGRIKDLQPSPTTGELYLTDVIAFANQDGRFVHAFEITDPDEMRGVNTPEQLTEVEALMCTRNA